MLESLPSQHLPDICAAIVKASYSEKIQVLDAVDLTERFKKALPLLMRQIEVRNQSIQFWHNHNYMFLDMNIFKNILLLKPCRF